MSFNSILNNPERYGIYVPQHSVRNLNDYFGLNNNSGNNQGYGSPCSSPSSPSYGSGSSGSFSGSGSGSFGGRQFMGNSRPF